MILNITLSFKRLSFVYLSKICFFIVVVWKTVKPEPPKKENQMLTLAIFGLSNTIQKRKKDNYQSCSVHLHR